MMMNLQENATNKRLGLIIATILGNANQSFANENTTTLRNRGPEDDDELEEDEELYDDDFEEPDPLEEIPDEDELEQEDDFL
ncbi:MULTISPECIES: hypothetical protein [Sphingobacterium]|uniref:hypothetical protein n=1 Tax=Sphingobacterium TaxID=28453 RepID=UPI001048226E|nr:MULTISPECIES: hypothetical protein [Sphingobacterium]MCW2259087.1 hypothetical protein [Sphingobacterium kitahiroshimense]TCR14462.1 hypothetical protein EDF67_101566 [Sphingobacterium sp. JUb78]